jgi:hypothetical protein
MARPHIEPYVELDHPFKKFDLSGFRGSHYKVLSLDKRHRRLHAEGPLRWRVQAQAGPQSYSDMEKSSS